MLPVTVPVPRWRGTTASWAHRLATIEAHPFDVRTREEIRAMNADPEPGFYVSAMNDVGQRILAEGPFEHHVDALCAVRGVSLAWGDADPRAHWYAWGTAKVHGGGS